MRIAIAYALHHPELMDLPTKRLRLEEVGTLEFEPVDHDAFPCLRLAAGGRQGRRHRAVRAERRQRGRRPRLPRRRPGLPGDPGGHRVDARAAARRPGPRVRVALRGRPRGPRPSPPSRSRSAHELVPGLRRLRAADHPPRVRALHRGEGRRHARRALQPVLPAAGLEGQARRDRVRDRHDPARRLREDQRHEPAGGAARRGRPPRLLPPAGVEADRRDRRRAGRELPDRVRADRRDLRRPGHARELRRGQQRREGHPGGRPAAEGRQGALGRRRPRLRARPEREADRAAPARPARRDQQAPLRRREHGGRTARGATPAKVVVERDGQRRTLLVTPRYDTASTGACCIGITYGAYRDVGPAALGAVLRPGDVADQPAHRQRDRQDLLRLQGAQGGVGRRRLLRDHTLGDPARHRDRRCACWRSSRCRWPS